MDRDLQSWELKDDMLLAKVREAWDRFSQDRTEENRDAHRKAVRELSDWVLRGRVRDFERTDDSSEK